VRDDAQLVKAALAGDSGAFGTLVERHQDRLYNTLFRVLGCREDARDVVQEAFVQAFTKLSSFQGAAKFYTWLYRIGMNLALSQLRRRRPTASVDDMKGRIGQEPVDRQAGPDQTLAQNEQVETVQRALNLLGDEPRQILVLRELEGCSYDTIAEILSLPIGTVRSRLFRARLQLREKLREKLQQQLPDEVDSSQ